METTKRIDRLERSVSAVVGKIDAVIVKLEAVDRVSSRKKTPTLAKRPVSRGSVAPSKQESFGDDSTANFV